MFEAMAWKVRVGESARAKAVVGNALELPYDDGTFDVVIASEILESTRPGRRRCHRRTGQVLKPGGTLAVTVPAGYPNGSAGCSPTSTTPTRAGTCGSDRASDLRAKIASRGMTFVHTHHAHALHSPPWWPSVRWAWRTMKNGPSRPTTKLVWDMMSAPALTRTAEAALDPLIGKSAALTSRSPRAVVLRGDGRWLTFRT